MGFGHRVYRAEDPRARVLRAACERLGAPRFEVAAALEGALDELHAATPNASSPPTWSSGLPSCSTSPRSRPRCSRADVHLPRSAVVRPHPRAEEDRPAHPAQLALRRPGPPAGRVRRRLARLTGLAASSHPMQQPLLAELLPTTHVAAYPAAPSCAESGEARRPTAPELSTGPQRRPRGIRHPAGMELHDLARHHVVSTRDATRLGLGPSDLRRMVKQGEIRRLYAVDMPWAHPTPRAPRGGRRRVGDRASAAPSAQRRASTLIRGPSGGKPPVRAGAARRTPLEVGPDDRPPLPQRRRPHPSAASGHSAPGVRCPGGRDRGRLHHRAGRRRWSRSASERHGRSPPFPSRAWSPPTQALHDGLVTKEEARGGGQGAQQAPRHTWRAHPPRPSGRSPRSGETRLAHTMRALGYRFAAGLGQCWGPALAAASCSTTTPSSSSSTASRKYSGGLPDPSPERAPQDLRGEEVARGPAARHRT